MTEALKSLWEKLYAWAIPSALALGAYWLFVDPKVGGAHDWLKGTSGAEQGIVYAALTITVAFCLNVFSTPLYRVLEGYLWWPRWAQERGARHQLKRKHELQAGARERQHAATEAPSPLKRELQSVKLGAGWLRGLALEKPARYPLRDDQVVPTRFGNAIRSFETYGKTRFGLDSQTLWNEIFAVAPKYIQDQHDRARSWVDFFVAAIYLSFALSMLTLTIILSRGFDSKKGIVFVVAVALTLLSHWLAVRATDEWGFAVQALVNLGRVPLADSLGLQLPESLAEEQKMWGLVTSYVFFGTSEEGLQLDRFRKKEVQPPDACPTTR